jgi:hypothetical protein
MNEKESFSHHFFTVFMFGQEIPKLTDEMAMRLSENRFTVSIRNIRTKRRISSIMPVKFL